MSIGLEKKKENGFGALKKKIPPNRKKRKSNCPEDSAGLKRGREEKEKKKIAQ